ncbi:alpha/beta fold hydrolase [Pusillimonas sp. TS35]|uniref:alpha/beta fold hydrolase n=1 Tax=Paracandidimonas lactea TaxID=2895524 RepID=UPI001370874E|nr:alpha/beta hydrolase [Paracandidimonas lactea]MYN13889.1 alpha/beta fold hydrolase [Pusillimonas sp. TS35]
MKTITTSDQVRLAVTEHGSGDAIVFVHEFAGDMRSWHLQIRHFARRYRCVAFNARGYSPSDTPDDVDLYSQSRARDDIRDVMNALGIERAHVVGLSMGAFATLHFGLEYPERAVSLLLAGCGYGAEPARRAAFQKDAQTLAQTLEAQGMKAIAPQYARGPARVQFEGSDPLGFAEFEQALATHSTIGSARTMAGVQAMRPSLWDMTDRLRALTVPVLIVNGDEDQGCLTPGLFMKEHIASCGMATLPCTGHTPNLEEPALFNMLAEDLFHRSELGKWPMRDPRSMSGSALGDIAPR